MHDLKINSLVIKKTNAQIPDIVCIECNILRRTQNQDNAISHSNNPHQAGMSANLIKNNIASISLLGRPGIG